MLSKEQLSFVSQVAPFREVSPDEIEKFCAACSVTKVQAKQDIFAEGALGNVGYLVLSGRVAMIKRSPNGKEFIAELLPAGELFGVIVLLNSQSYPLTARAQVASELLAIPAAAVESLTAHNAEFMRQLMGIMTNRMKSLQNVARSLAHDSVDVRVAATLLALIPRFGRGGESDIVEIEITRQEIADLTGIELETASRVVKSFEREGMLDLSRPKIVRILQQRPLQDVAKGARSGLT